MLAALLAVAAPPAASPAEAAGGCIDKLEIETPGETASVFGAVTLAAGETFRADIRHWTSAPTAATWRNGFNSDIRLSPMLDDGFPGYANTSQRDSFAADGPWDADGFMEDGTFTYTNPTSSNTTSFVLEVGYWNSPVAGIVGRTEASGFSTCVSSHSPPDRPTQDCAESPTLVANGANVHSEPFEMAKNAYISMRMVDERSLRYDGAGNQDPLLRNDYLIRAWLYGRDGPDDSWHYIRRDSHRSQNNWLRGSYVGSWDISLKNSSNYTEVKVIFGKWISRGYALSTPLDVSIKNPGGSWQSTCLTSAKTTVTWDAAPSCAADGTPRMQAAVANKSGRTAGYRLALFDLTNDNQIHSSLYQYIDSARTATVQLGGIPTGTWRMRLYELQADGSEVAVGFSTVSTFDGDSCPEPNEASTEWDAAPHCAADGTLATGVLVTNENDRTVFYRIDVIDMATENRIHASHEYEIAPGASRYITLGGIPTGTWFLQLSENDVAVPGTGWAQTFGTCEPPIDPPPDECEPAAELELAEKPQYFSNGDNPIFGSPLEPFNQLDCSDLVASVHDDQLLVATHQAGGYLKVQSGWIRIEDVESAEHLNYFDRMKRAFEALPNKPALEDVLAEAVLRNSRPPTITGPFERILLHDDVAGVVSFINIQNELTSVEKMYVWSLFDSYKTTFGGAFVYSEGASGPDRVAERYFVAPGRAHPDVVNDDVLGAKNTANHTVVGWQDGHHGGYYSIAPTLVDAAERILDSEQSWKSCTEIVQIPRPNECINWGDVESSIRMVFVMRRYMEELDFAQFARGWSGLMVEGTSCPDRLLSKERVLDTACASSL